MAFQPPRPERIEISGSQGVIEAILEQPASFDGARIGVICHPHPLHGGTMTNKVVHTLARTFNELGLATVRFNYRGVGGSAGVYDAGRGETDDAVSVIDWMQQRWPQARLWLAGFSFGGAVAIRAALQRRVENLITVAPAITRLDPSTFERPPCSWLVVQGDRDELVDASAVQSWVATLTNPPTLVVLPGAEHFFHGRLHDVRDTVLNWARENSAP